MGEAGQGRHARAAQLPCCTCRQARAAAMLGRLEGVCCRQAGLAGEWVLLPGRGQCHDAQRLWPPWGRLSGQCGTLLLLARRRALGAPPLGLWQRAAHLHARRSSSAWKLVLLGLAGPAPARPCPSARPLQLQPQRHCGIPAVGPGPGGHLGSHLLAGTLRCAMHLGLLVWVKSLSNRNATCDTDMRQCLPSDVLLNPPLASCDPRYSMPLQRC